MNLRYKNILSHTAPRGLVFHAVRVACVVAIAYFMGQAIASGARTLGAFIYSLFPVFAFGGILLLLETQKGNFGSLFSLPALSDIKASKKYLSLFVIMLTGGLLLVFYAGIGSPVDLVMVLLIIIAAGISVILMFRGQGVDALCIFILAWPLMIFERGGGNVVFRWTNNFNDLNIGIFSEDIVFYFYCLLLIGSWFLRATLNKEKIKSESWAPGFLLLLIAGLISTIFSSNPQGSWPYLINYYFIPVLFFILCVNEISSWDDFKKLSLVLGIMMAVVTLVWLYYALYRTPSPDVPLAIARGGGGKTLGSRYSGYNGIYYEYLAPMIIPVMLALASSTVSRFKRNIWIGITLLMIMTTLYTFGRVGYILLSACLLPWFWSFKRGRLLFLLLLAVLFITHYFTPEVISYISIRFKPLLSWQTVQDETRVKIWTAAIQMFIDHPWSGIGIRMFDQYAAEYGLSFLVKDKMGIRHFLVWTNAHGMLFQILSELGLFGLIAWCAMFWIPLRRLIKTHIPLRALSPKERSWVIAMKSNTIVISLLFFTGPFGNYGIESIRISIFILWLAIIRIMDNLPRNKSLENHVR